MQQANHEDGDKLPIIVAELKARVHHLETRVAFERKRGDAALDREANLYAQRYVLAVICAASVPSLGLALLAHRYDLHEWEARSDAMGVMLVLSVVLTVMAVSLWRKVRLQLEGEPSSPAGLNQDSTNVTDATNPNLDSQEISVPKLPVPDNVAGVRKRTRRFAGSMRLETKAEAVL
jgi:hypothetical protein